MLRYFSAFLHETENRRCWLRTGEKRVHIIIAVQLKKKEKNKKEEKSH